MKKNAIKKINRILFVVLNFIFLKIKLETNIDVVSPKFQIISSFLTFFDSSENIFLHKS